MLFLAAVVYGCTFLVNIIGSIAILINGIVLIDADGIRREVFMKLGLAVFICLLFVPVFSIGAVAIMVVGAMLGYYLYNLSS